MALPLQVGPTPAEIGFLCEMELVTVVPRQRLESLELLSGSTPTLRPPVRSVLPLWLALLLHRQKRANILPPPWLSQPSLASILETEVTMSEVFSPGPIWPNSREGAIDITSPPFLPTSTGDSKEGCLPYHWIEMGELLIAACGDEIPNCAAVMGLLRDIREVRASKLRAGMRRIEGGGVVSLKGVGAMELYGERGFMVDVIGGLRLLGATRESARREKDDVEGTGGDGEEEDEDDDMAI